MNHFLRRKTDSYKSFDFCLNPIMIVMINVYSYMTAYALLCFLTELSISLGQNYEKLSTIKCSTKTGHHNTTTAATYNN